MRTCCYCGERKIPDSARSHAKFCSSKCRVYSHRAGVSADITVRYQESVVLPCVEPAARNEGICAVCGALLSGRRRVVCSKGCGYRLQAIDRRGRHRGSVRERYSPFAVAERDGWICQICGESVDRDLRYPDRRCLSMDHVVPLSRGGDDVMENIQAAHLECNWGKGAKIIA